jgi:hypothetical protein
MQNYIDIGKYSIKIDDFFNYTFSCDDKAAKHCVKHKQCCCGIFFVETTKRNVDRIFNILDVVSYFCPHLKDGKGYLNPFEENEDNRYSIETKENGYCMFSYLDKVGALRCGIHSAALKLKAEPFFYKPLECSIWPVRIFEEKNSKTVVALDVDAGGGCLKKKNKIDGKIDPVLFETLVLLLGKKITFTIKKTGGILSES